MFELSDRYRQELEDALNLIKKDSQLKPIEKEILKTIIGCEKFAGYEEGEFEENLKLYDKIAELLEKELINIGQKTYSKFKWWFYKKIFIKDIGYLSNFIIANWFSLIDSHEERVNCAENEIQIEETYILHKTFLNHEDVEEILNLEKKEGLNVIHSIWLDKEQIKEAVHSFLSQISTNKSLKSSVKEEIYYDNGKWFSKRQITKHKWKKRYKLFLEKNISPKI